MQDIDVVIVAFKSARTVARAIASVGACSRANAVVVVDNASHDGSADASRAAGASLVIENPANVGFAAGVNQGLRACGAAYALLLNPDAELEPGSLDRLAAALDDDAKAAMVGAVLLADDGRMVLGARRFSTVVNRLLWHLPLPWRPSWSTPEYGDRASMAAAPAPVPVDYLWGAALLVRRSFLDVMGGGLDERFFLYSEDEDLGRQARARGMKCLLVPLARAAHIGGASTSDRALALARIITANAMLLEKWEGAAAAGLYRRLIGPVLTTRAFVLRAAGRSEEAQSAALTRSYIRDASTHERAATPSAAARPRLL